MSSKDAPPSFRFYPGAYDDGAIAPDDRPCELCGHARGQIYQGSLMGASPPTHVCPWCIADGSAGAAANCKFGAFNEVTAGVASDVRDEVANRTPAPISWQDFIWPAHEGVPMIFEGRVTYDDVKYDASRLAALRAAAPDEETMIKWVSKDGDLNVMLFRSMDGRALIGICDAS